MCTWHACLARLALSVPLLVIALPAQHFQLRLGCAPAAVHPEFAVRACRRPSEAVSRCRQSQPAQDHGTCDTPGSIEVHWAGSHRRWHSPRRDLSALGLAVPSMRALCCCTPQWRSPPWWLSCSDLLQRSRCMATVCHGVANLSGPRGRHGHTCRLARGMGIRTGPGRCREARPMHLNRDWTMQECSGEGRASEHGLATSEWT